MGLSKNQISIILDNIKQYIDNYTGSSGNDGITPHIDESTKHWFIGDTDTGILAEGKDGEGSSITVDSAMSSTSTNPVQNKVIKEYVDNKSTNVSAEDGNAIVNKSDGIYVEDLTEELGNLNIAQKTVNEVGSKSLLNSPVSFTVTAASTSGTGKVTTLNKNITLNDDITNYDYIDIYIQPSSSSKKRLPQSVRVKVNKIVYNNSTTKNLANGSMLSIWFNMDSVASSSYAIVHFIFMGWFKNSTTLYLSEFTNPATDSAMTAWTITDIVGIKDKTIIVDPVEYVNTNNGIEDTPVGHIIPFMGNNAPAHYLICDGSTYKIADYPYLSQHFKDEFGKVNYFGGDGITTFSVPDLRGEFLRGTGNNSHTNQGSGDDVGIHQDATEHLNLHLNQYKYITLSIDYNKNSSSIGQYNIDSNADITHSPNAVPYVDTVSGREDYIPSHYTSRPTNTSVLYCIKYEPTYFMQNTFAGFNKTTLFEGEANTSGTTYDLSDSVKNYDMILAKIRFYNNDDLNQDTFIIDVDDINNASNNAFVRSFTSGTSDIRDIGFNFSQGYNKISINWVHNSMNSDISITKIIGIKSSLASSGGGCPTYTDEEIQQMVSNILSDSSTSGNGNYTDEEIKQGVSDILGGVS